MQEKPFRAHVNRATDADVLEGLIVLDGEPKISDFRDTGITHENVGRFKIPMNNVSLIKIKQTLEQFVYDAGYVLFMEEFVVEDHFFKIPSAVVFGDDVAIILALKYVKTPDDILVVQLFKDGHFVLEQLLGYFGGQ